MPRGRKAHIDKPDSLGGVIRLVRTEARVPMTTVARVLSISVTTLGEWETNLKIPTREDLLAVWQVIQKETTKPLPDSYWEHMKRLQIEAFAAFEATLDRVGQAPGTPPQSPIGIAKKRVLPQWRQAPVVVEEPHECVYQTLALEGGLLIVKSCMSCPRTLYASREFSSRDFGSFKEILV